ncbi:hypothetical protein OCAE111667_25715 [Occultella aeris]|uniref:Uncharacterized protein n=1 Tax=Occultella aeris TaxID=2761496 RepID=A0A7M4DFN8_9MICO|nr:hypothetical protein HALOF300_00929 [Occultella aeris]
MPSAAVRVSMANGPRPLSPIRPIGRGGAAGLGMARTVPPAGAPERTVPEATARATTGGTDPGAPADTMVRTGADVPADDWVPADACAPTGDRAPTDVCWDAAPATTAAPPTDATGNSILGPAGPGMAIEPGGGSAGAVSVATEPAMARCARIPVSVATLLGSPSTAASERVPSLDSSPDGCAVRGVAGAEAGSAPVRVSVTPSGPVGWTGDARCWSSEAAESGDPADRWTSGCCCCATESGTRSPCGGAAAPAAAGVRFHLSATRCSGASVDRSAAGSDPTGVPDRSTAVGPAPTVGLAPTVGPAPTVGSTPVVAVASALCADVASEPAAIRCTAAFATPPRAFRPSDSSAREPTPPSAPGNVPGASGTADCASSKGACGGSTEGTIGGSTARGSGPTLPTMGTSVGRATMPGVTADVGSPRAAEPTCSAPDSLDSTRIDAPVGPGLGVPVTASPVDVDRWSGNGAVAGPGDAAGPAEPTIGPPAAPPGGGPSVPGVGPRTPADAGDDTASAGDAGLNPEADPGDAAPVDVDR